MSLADAGPVSRRARQQVRLQDGMARTLHRPDLDGIVKRVFGFEAAELDASPEAPPKARNFEIALNALRRGAANLDDLQQRCVDLEGELAANAERYRSELDGARQELTRWQMLATELGAKLQQSQEQLADAERQGKLQAERMAAETRRADAAERRTQGLERITLAFHDSLLDVFGGAPGAPKLGAAA